MTPLHIKSIPHVTPYRICLAAIALADLARAHWKGTPLAISYVVYRRHEARVLRAFIQETYGSVAMFLRDTPEDDEIGEDVLTWLRNNKPRTCMLPHCNDLAYGNKRMCDSCGAKTGRYHEWGA
ncbi:MAG: hypothetical protein AAFQ58_19180 [Pseudomonadota bacterium]